MKSKISIEKLNTFFLSTQSWEKTSKNIAKEISTDIFYSPENNVFEFKGSLEQYNILMFNLHGASTTHCWYGENINNIQPALGIKKLPDILAVEACYGARPYNDGYNKESMLNTALVKGCCAFVGSTQIAYGCTDGKLRCADIIEKYFIENIIEGYSSGESFNNALAHLNESGWDDCSLKTLMEFALYGDPSYAVLNSENKFKPKLKYKSFEKNNLSYRSYRIVEGMEQKSVNVKSAYVEENMDHVLKSFVEESAPQLIDVKPLYFIDECTGDYQAVYSKNTGTGNISKILKVFFNADGSVKSKYISK